MWLAGPISGLIAQPVIGINLIPYIIERFLSTHNSLGALSDSSSSKYRRRFWIVLSTAALVVSTLLLAFCQDIAAFLVDLVGVGSGDWSEKRQEQVQVFVYFH